MTSYEFHAGRRGDTLPRTIHANVAPLCVEKCCEDGMDRAFVKAVWTFYEADGIDLETILSLSGQRAFPQKSDNGQTSDGPDRVDNGEDIWDFQDMVTAEEVAMFGIHGKLREVQRVCEDGSEAVSTAIVGVVDLAREGVETKRENAKLFD